MTLQARLKAAMEQHNLTPYSAARYNYKLGVSQSTLHRVLKGLPVRQDSINAVTAALNRLEQPANSFLAGIDPAILPRPINECP